MFTLIWGELCSRSALFSLEIAECPGWHLGSRYLRMGEVSLTQLNYLMFVPCFYGCKMKKSSAKEIVLTIHHLIAVWCTANDITELKPVTFLGDFQYLNFFPDYWLHLRYRITECLRLAGTPGGYLLQPLPKAPLLYAWEYDTVCYHIYPPVQITYINLHHGLGKVMRLSAYFTELWKIVVYAYLLLWVCMARFW